MTHLRLIKNGKETSLELARIPGMSLPGGRLVAWKLNSKETDIFQEIYYWKWSPKHLVFVERYRWGTLEEDYCKDHIIVDEALFVEATARKID